MKYKSLVVISIENINMLIYSFISSWRLIINKAKIENFLIVDALENNKVVTTARENVNLVDYLQVSFPKLYKHYTARILTKN